MEFQGKIIYVSQPFGGTSQKSGKQWSKIQFVVEETNSQFPKKALFDVFGKERYDQMPIAVGNFVSVTFTVDSHEYNGKWYNTLNAESVVATQPQQQPQYQPQPQYQQQQFSPQPIQPQQNNQNNGFPF